VDYEIHQSRKISGLVVGDPSRHALALRQSTWMKEMNPGPSWVRTAKTQGEHASPLSTHCNLERRGARAAAFNFAMQWN